MKIAFVTPWYGRDIPGGAEAEARHTAVQLHQAGYPVEVLTTCIRDLYSDWGKNHHSPGVETIDGIPVRRFAVQKRDKLAFDQINWRLMQGQAISAAEETIFNNEMFRCPDLLTYIEQHQQQYLFIFIPYMFASSYFGASICPERSLMIPCLHDEAYARLQIHRQVLPQLRALLFYTEAEQTLAAQLYPPTAVQIRQVIGGGVETDWQGDGRRFRQKYQLADTPLVLYAGRREAGKNLPLLLDYWATYSQERNPTAKLLLLGPGQLAIPAAAQTAVIDLGFVPAQDKYDAYAAANLFCMPSVNESFSIVIMESWLAGTPVLVHGRCAVTREHVHKANGGLYFSNYDEFAATVDYLLANPATAVRLGQQGRQYVLDRYQWPTIVDQYSQIINQIAAELTPEVPNEPAH